VLKKFVSSFLRLDQYLQKKKLNYNLDHFLNDSEIMFTVDNLFSDTIAQLLHGLFSDNRIEKKL